MEITFKSKKLQKTCSIAAIAQKELGKEMAAKLMQRLTELAAANHLGEVSRLPPARCHLLTGDRQNQFSIDLKHPYRLLFIPTQTPAPRKPDGGYDLAAITAIEIIAIDDTHG
jgi:plasmid maintenance system killer protein